MMRLRSLAATVLFAATLATAPASAAEIRFPHSGNPAFTYNLPGSWASKMDKDGNMLLTAGNHTSGISLSLVKSASSLDKLASGAMKVTKGAAPRRGETVRISGFKGYVYRSHFTNRSGVLLKVKMVAIRIDARHIATASLITAANDSAAQVRAGESVLDSIRLIGP